MPNPDEFATMRVAAAPTEVAPDGSAVRALLGLAGGTVAHFELPAGGISRAIAHRTVEEVWFVLSGTGELWRMQGAREETVALEPGVCVSMPRGTHFQFRAAKSEPLRFVAATIPRWPGDGEAERVPGPWESSLPQQPDSTSLDRAFEGRRSVVKEPNPWLEASDVFPIFSTLVWKLVLRPELRDVINEKVLATLEGPRRDQQRLEPRRGWQSEQALHLRDEFRELVSCINNATESILRFLRIGQDAFEITGCWATILAQGAVHSAHSHPNNFLSGVYYVRTLPGADSINFHDPRRQAYVIRPPVVELTAENTDQVVVRVAAGTLLMFPSYLEHSVSSNASAGERISISFNVMFSSFARELSKPLW